MIKILIIRFSSIGDIVLTTPVIRCVKQQLNAEVHFLTKKSFASIVENNPYVDKVFAIQKDIDEVKNALLSEAYDYVIDLHHNLRSWQVKRHIGAKSFSFDKINIHKWLIVNVKINILPKNHIVDRYLDTVKSLGVKNDHKGLDYFIPSHDEVDILNNFPNIFPQQYIAFVIGAAHATKRMTTSKIIEVCKNLPAKVILLGGKEEYNTGEEIAKESGIHVINACGKFNLNQSSSIVRQAKIVITHDTGLMHIAAAFQKKIISIWGNTVPDFGMYPYYADHKNLNISVENKEINCRPCSKIGYDKCPKGHFKCMQDIDIQLIMKNINQ